MEGSEQAARVAPPAQRVRTGCLTCRKRHLKCDEAKPTCENCRKGRRECKRGLRLTFTNVFVLSEGLLPWVLGTLVDFVDESKSIASEYEEGFLKKPTRAAVSKAERSLLKKKEPTQQCQAGGPKVAVYQRILPAPKTIPVADGGNGCEESYKDMRRSQKISTRQYKKLLPGFSPSSRASEPPGLRSGGDFGPLSILRHASLVSDGFSKDTIDEFWHPQNPFDNTQAEEYLSSEHQICFTQEFVESVGKWIDCFDGQSEFSHSLPFRALDCPMLLNAMYACGARRKLGEVKRGQYDWSQFYYSTATTKLLHALSRPNTDMANCAITSVILHVYETMADRIHARAHHSRGSRAIINFCHWNASSGGIASASFWLSVGMETLNCLTSHSQVTWDPRSWGFTLTFPAEQSTDTSPAEEAVWLHRVLYIAAMTVNFRARGFHVDPNNEMVQMGERLPQWQELKTLCDAWSDLCPRSMAPIGYTDPKPGTSVFPYIWLIHPSAVMARLFYHVIQYLLAEINPVMPIESRSSMRDVRLHHARQVCGIAVRCKPHIVPGILIQSLALVGVCLVREDEKKGGDEPVGGDTSEERLGYQAGRDEAEARLGVGFSLHRAPVCQKGTPKPGQTSPWAPSASWAWDIRRDVFAEAGNESNQGGHQGLTASHHRTRCIL
uniref:Zn(2)-C6 fungal-type domain-containing protein n=1 Tax=Bionectria ochroleuca TaxID=29856 RepID=A0A8H7N6R2_BIOOC